MRISSARNAHLLVEKCAFVGREMRIFLLRDAYLFEKRAKTARARSFQGFLGALCVLCGKKDDADQVL
jgi:hypothetical protein